jgi:histidinol-phosphate/aromatic aminotransferase/cobyric acid decarboxylase-like protein
VVAPQGEAPRPYPTKIIAIPCTAVSEGIKTALREAEPFREEIDLDTIATNCRIVGGSAREPSDLAGELSRRHGLGSSNILVSNSSISILRKLLSLAECVGIPVPDYFEYSGLCRSHRELQREENWALPGISADVDAIVLSNPNNPTGTYHTLERLIRETAERNILLVVDEAYIEFIGEENSAANALADYPNLVVLRTFSKFYGMTQDKVGYALADERILRAIGEVEPPTEKAAREAEARLNCLNRREIVEDVTRRRERLERILGSAGCEYTAGSANFLMARHKTNLHDWLGKLRVKTVNLNTTYGIIDEGWCRLAVGSDEQLDELERRLAGWEAPQ